MMTIIIMIRPLSIRPFRRKILPSPTDAKLHKKIVDKVLAIVHKLDLPLRQSYTFVLKGIYRDQRFRNHPKNRKKALREDKKLRTIAGRLVRELKRNLGEQSLYDELIERFEDVLSQRRNSPKKIYSIHEPEVQCIHGRRIMLIAGQTCVALFHQRSLFKLWNSLSSSAASS